MTSSSGNLEGESPFEASYEPPTTAEVIDAPPIRYGANPEGRVGVGFHVGLLALCSAVLLASIILDVSQGSVTAPVAGIPLPGLCTFKRMTGVDCPGCGLTRCFVSISHGRLQDAWSFNPAGIFLYVVVVFQIPYRILQLRRVKRGLPEIDLGFFGGGFLLLAAIVLFVQWAFRASTSL